YASSTFNKCVTLLTMPRTAGLSAVTMLWFMRRRPRARTVRLWRSVAPMGMRTSVILIFLPLFLAAILLASVAEGLELLHVFAAHACLLIHGLELGKRVQSGHDDVVNVAAAHGFGQDVMHAHGLHDGAHTTAGDDAGTRGGRLEQNLRAAHAANDRMRDGAAVHVHAAQFLARPRGGLA